MEDTPEETKKVDDVVSGIADSLNNQTSPTPSLEVEQEQEPAPEKKKRKPRKKKIVEPTFDLEDASSLVSLPFVMWGKPLSPEENTRLTSVASRWLDQRADGLAKYSVDIALAVCLLEVLLKRTDILSKIIAPSPPLPPTPEEQDAK